MFPSYRWQSFDRPIRLGVSQCLLGDLVRYDGGHARSRFVSDELAPWVEFVPVCPEVGIGMGTPRPAIRIVETDSDLQLIAPSTGENFTSAMLSFSRSTIAKLQTEQLDGFVLKKSSPTCGTDRLKVYREDVAVRKDGVGFFAAELMRLWPNLPIEDEGRLNDGPLRENFIGRIFARSRWHGLIDSGLNRGSLVEFHTAHKLLLLSHSEPGYRRLGRIVASLGMDEDSTIFEEYESVFNETLQTKPTPKAHVNVMQHALGHLKSLLSSEEKQEILRSIEDFKKGHLPLLVPINLIAFCVRVHQVEYLMGQIYFAPHPKELMLRNHA